MTRHVFSNNELAHEWAHKRVDYGRTSNSNFYFEDGVIFSYGRHFAIASHGENNTVFFTNDSYSVTTAKHIGLVRQAASHLRLIYVDDPLHPTTQLANLIVRVQKAEDNLLKKRAYSTKMQAIGELNHERDNLRSYIDYMHQHHAKDEIWAIQQRTHQGNLDKDFIFNDTPKVAEVRAWCVEYSANYETNRAKERALQEKRNQGKIAKWKAGETENLSFQAWNAPTRLRVTPGGDVQTSKGIHITRRDAMAAIALFNAGRLLGHKLANYTITRVDHEQEIVVAGCHTVPFSEIYEIESALKPKAVAS